MICSLFRIRVCDNNCWFLFVLVHMIACFLLFHFSRFELICFQIYLIKNMDSDVLLDGICNNHSIMEGSTRFQRSTLMVLNPWVSNSVHNQNAVKFHRHEEAHCPTTWWPAFLMMRYIFQYCWIFQSLPELLLNLLFFNSLQ
jgi:hypothetical protein